MKKRLARVLAATLAASTVLTGCGGGSEKKSVNGKAPEKQKITEDVTKTEGKINVWTNLSQDEMNFYVEEFNKIVPGVKVNVTVMPSKEYRTKLQNAFRTGTNAPDVATFEISDFGVYKDSDMLENLSQEQYGADAISKDMIPNVLLSLILQGLHVLHVFHYHKSNLECDRIFKHTKIQTCALLQLIQPVHKCISVDV